MSKKRHLKIIKKTWLRLGCCNKIPSTEWLTDQSSFGDKVQEQHDEALVRVLFLVCRSHLLPLSSHGRERASKREREREREIISLMSLLIRA
jgi:hypothetical protein